MEYSSVLFLSEDQEDGDATVCHMFIGTVEWPFNGLTYFIILTLAS
jgi:hypothetical protein